MKVGFIWNSSVVGSVTKAEVPKFNWLFLYFNVILQVNLEEFENFMIKEKYFFWRWNTTMHNENKVRDWLNFVLFFSIAAISLREIKAACGNLAEMLMCPVKARCLDLILKTNYYPVVYLWKDCISKKRSYTFSNQGLKNSVQCAQLYLKIRLTCVKY